MMSSSVQIRERLRIGFDNETRGTAFCPSGLHPNGRCACDSLFMHEESSTRASISRIVMLAEALFEVGLYQSSVSTFLIITKLDIHVLWMIGCKQTFLY